MDTFANYILSEKCFGAKLEIVYYLAKKEKIFFDKSVVFKTELARLFLKYSILELDSNLILTASLLCACKKVRNARDFNEIKSYARCGASYLKELGFDYRFCKICEEVNRYSESNPRERESDVLELVDQFGGMILDRPERIGFQPDEALVLLKHRNLKDNYNRYIESFDQFIKVLQRLNMSELSDIKPLKKLTKMYNDTDDLTDFIKKVLNQFEPEIDVLMAKRYKEIEQELFKNDSDVVCNYRPLFTEETTKKIVDKI